MRFSRTGNFLKDKIKTLPELKKISERLKKQGKVLVFTNGCFDLLHYGHVKYLEDARKQGDVLIVAVNSDDSVKRIKGKNRPIMKERDRLRVVAGLESVDYVIKFSQDTPEKLIRALNPDVLVKGADWKKNDIVGADIVSKSSGKVVRIKLVKGSSTSNLIKKIARHF